MTAKQRVVIIPDQPEEGINGYGGKTLRKGMFSDESKKCHEKGQQAVQDQSITMEKSWVMMMDRTDKEHEE